MRKWLVATFVVVITVLAGCGGGGNGAGTGGIGLGPGFGGQPGSSGGTAQKIIIDSDYNTMSDDGQLGVMAAQLQADGKVQVMGISVVSGNQWLKQGVADALMSVERLGVGDRIGVYVGANYALNHTLADVDAEMAAGAGGDGYLGAWSGPEPKTDADLKPSPDGFAKHTVVQRKNAVDFIVDTVKANPGEVTILAIGPLTNIALAVKQNPEIVPLIKKIIYMGGPAALRRRRPRACARRCR
jgi:purine nucleosidase